MEGEILIYLVNNDRNYKILIIYGIKKERIKDLKKVKTRLRNTNQ